jgi:hypothetical protein
MRTSPAAGPINVAGNVIDEETQTPLSSFNVGLYPTEHRQGGQLTNGTTNGQGIYNMNASDVGQDVTEVWVTSEMAYRKAHPVWVDLRTNRQAATASDALRVESQSAALSSNESNKAADYVAAVFETRGIQSYSGALSRNNAEESAFYDTSPLFAAQRGNEEGFSSLVSKSFQKRIQQNEGLWSEIQSINKAVFERNKFK